MFFRLVVALVLGAVLGLEREIVGKEAGIRTEMVVAAGAAIFAMVGLALPYITAAPGTVPDAITATAGFGVIASIVSGIGFLGAGLIIKMNDHPRGITTAALVWGTAGIGILVGIGMIAFAATSAILITALLYFLRKFDLSERPGEMKQ